MTDDSRKTGKTTAPPHVEVVADRTDDGTYEMQTYKRVLSGLGMELEFTSVSDGTTLRRVEGRLTKRAD